jgi:hypothetical protein
MIKLVGLIFILFPLSQAQFDRQWCPDGPSAPIPDPKWSTIPTRFEIMAELFHDKVVMEISQAFSTTRDSIFKNSATSILLFVIIFS